MMIDGVRAMDRATEVVLRYLTAFNRGDADALLDCLGPDVVHQINQGAVQTGRVAFDRYVENHRRCFDERLADIVVLASADGVRAAAEFVIHGQYREQAEGMPPARGQTYRLGAAAFFDVIDGQITRVCEYANHSDWLEQIRA